MNGFNHCVQLKELRVINDVESIIEDIEIAEAMLLDAYFRLIENEQAADSIVRLCLTGK